MEGFLKAILQIGIFMVCTQAIVHFRPDSSYEKYLKMLVSAMVLIQIFAPIMDLFLSGEGSMEERIRYFQEELADSMGGAEQITERADRILEDLTAQEALRWNREAQEPDEDEAGQGKTTGEGEPGEKEEGAKQSSMAEKEISDGGALGKIVIDRVQIGREGEDGDGSW